MPHIVSLIVCYGFIVLAFIFLLKGARSCTTKPQVDLPVKTEHSPTGPTPTTSHYQHRARQAGKTAELRSLQEDTDFLSRHTTNSDLFSSWDNYMDGGDRETIESKEW